MKKNQKRVIYFFNQIIKSPHFIKNVFVFIAFLIFFSLSIFFIWKRHEGKKEEVRRNIPQEFSYKDNSQTILETKISLEKEIELLSRRVSDIEKKNAQMLQPINVSEKFITVELLNGVLDGLICLTVLKKSLKRSPEPWKVSLLATISPLQKIKSYSQLEELLVFPPPRRPLSLWNRIKREIKNFILIREIDEKGNYQFGQLKDLKKALQNQNILKAMECFEKLPIKEKNKLSGWKKSANDRLVIETYKKDLLLEIVAEKGL